MTSDDRRVVEGFKLPSTAPLTDNEKAWIVFLRMIVGDREPAPKWPGWHRLPELGLID